MSILIGSILLSAMWCGGYYFLKDYVWGPRLQPYLEEVK